jgi:hypothetical protein
MAHPFLGNAMYLGNMPLASNLIEAANRAEATALLIRSGYRVYRPEADVSGEDLILRTPTDELIAVQLKSRPTVNHAKYGRSDMWMLFPDPLGQKPGREWFLIKHAILAKWWEQKHGSTKSWETGWSTPNLSADLKQFLLSQNSVLQPRTGETDPI